MRKEIKQVLYLTTNIIAENGSEGIRVLPPVLLLHVPMDYTGQVILNYNQGKLGSVQKNWKESFRPIELSDKGFDDPDEKSP